MRICATLTFTVVTIFFCSWSNADIDHKSVPTKLRSAFLGEQVWSSDELANQSEINRQLKAHFEEVIQILHEQEHASLNEALERVQRYPTDFTDCDEIVLRKKLLQRRRNQIDVLRQYAARGTFPQNSGHSKMAVPIFVDNNGTHCAVGYLMHRAGYDEVVDQIVDENNLVLVSQIESGPALNWILQSGLTQQEAALIQPSYAPPAFDAVLSDFSEPGFSVSKAGLTVSDLMVTRHSFQAQAVDLQTQFSLAVIEVEFLGLPLAQPEAFGIAVGEGVHDPGFGKKKLTYQPNLNNWIFFGAILPPLSEPNPGDDAIMYRFVYRVSSEDQSLSLATIASSGIFNANFIGSKDGAIQISTSISNASGFFGQGTISADGMDFILDDFEFINSGGNEIFVTTYALDLRGEFGFGGFTSFWNEFDLILVGDVNCDGVINLLDVDPFIDAIVNDFPEPKADVNMDGSDDLMDVVDFVQLLVGG